MINYRLQKCASVSIKDCDWLLSLLSNFIMMNLRIPQIRYLAAIVATISLSFALYPSKSLMGQSSRVFNFLYFFTFISHYGAQFWMTFVAGLLLFFNLPRIWFGHVQSKLFPLFFCFGFVTSSVTIAIFASHHKHGSHDVQLQIAALLISLGADFINAFLLSPIIVESMLTRFSLEKKSGKAYEVGFTDLSELLVNPEYACVNRTFRLSHGLSGGINMIGLAANTFHLYHIAMTNDV
ncbi:transmembrane protein 205-like [Pecten maximus]|uniref:transmembrane protein 205-like n=1 Tax=Pecten maximus TaxID=6579 RepID=UPI001458F118|nr:transmembrane protein 205-like [Pecten maximus]